MTWPKRPAAPISRVRVEYVGPDRPNDMKPGDRWDGNVLCLVAWWTGRWPQRIDVTVDPTMPVCWIGPEGVLRPTSALSGRDWMVVLDLDRYPRAQGRFTELLMPADGQVLPHEQPAAGGYVDHLLRKQGTVL